MYVEVDTKIILQISENLKTWKWKNFSRNHAFLFLFPLTLDIFVSNWWQNPKCVFIIINLFNVEIKFTIKII